MRHRGLPILALVAEGVASAVDALESSTLRTTLAMAAVAASVCAVLVAGAAAHGVTLRVRRDALSDGTRGFVVYQWPALGAGVPLGSADARALSSVPQVAGAAAHQTVVLPVGAGGRLRAGTRIVPLASRRMSSVLAALGLTLAGLGMLLLMRRSVRSRRREIGMRKVLGATRAAILFEIAAESSTLATLGGLAGLAAGRGIAMLMAGATPIPASVTSAAALTALGLTIAGGAALGAPPAIRAARLDVLHALRGK